MIEVMGYLGRRRGDPESPQDRVTRVVTLLLYLSMLAVVIISVWRGISSLG